MSSSQSAMKNLTTSFLFLLLSLFGASGQLSGQETDDFKVAGVDVQRVFQEFHKTRQTEKDVNEERIRIQKSDRQFRGQLKLVDRNLGEEAKKGDDESLTEEAKELHDQKMKRLVFERNKLNQERLAGYEQSNNQLNRDMMATMQGILGEIQRFVAAHAEKSDYSLVLDTSGTSTNQTTLVLGGKGIIDITATVIAELNKDDPAHKELR